MTTVYYRRTASFDPRLNRHVRHDPASRAYAYQPKATKLTTVRHKRHVPVFDQAALGSCTANAGLGCCGTGRVYEALQANGVTVAFTERQAVADYGAITRMDPYPGQYPPDDTGSDGLTAAKFAKAIGRIEGYQHTFTLADALLALQDGPFITGINWYDSFYDLYSEGIVSVTPTASVAGGHEIVADAYDAERALVGCVQSWGRWGVADPDAGLEYGRFWIPVDVYDRLLREQGDVTVFTPLTSVAPAPGPVPTPVPADPDSTLAAVLRPWVNRHHIGMTAQVAAAAKIWLAARDL